MSPAALGKRPLRALVAGALLLGFLFTAAAASGGAQGSLPSAPEGRVSDYAQLLTPAERQTLETQLVQYERSLTRTGDRAPQLALAIFPELSGVPIEDFSIRLAERWKIGSKADDGLLMTVAVKEHEVRIEVGYGLEGRLPDVVSSRIIRDIVVPSFRRGEYAAGLRAGMAGVHQALLGVPVTGRDEFSTASALPLSRQAPADTPMPVAGYIGGGVLLLLFILLLIFGGPGVRGFLGWIFLSSLLGGRRGGGGGGSVFGGGGGTFGGGGATGKW